MKASAQLDGSGISIALLQGLDHVPRMTVTGGAMKKVKLFPDAFIFLLAIPKGLLRSIKGIGFLLLMGRDREPKHLQFFTFLIGQMSPAPTHVGRQDPSVPFPRTCSMPRLRRNTAT